MGESKYTEKRGVSLGGLSEDGFRIKAGNNWLALCGRDYSGKPMAGIGHPFRLQQSYSGKLKINRYGETGTLFAVYRFLEQFCGIRWYMPGDLGEVVPAGKTVSVPDHTDLSVSPDFKYRFLYACDLAEDDDSAKWYRRAGFGASFPVNIQHSFHTFRKYKDTHPEYFALINGQRDFNVSCAGHGNLCLANPDVLARFVAEAKAFFDKNPEQKIFSVMPNDSFTRICECPECQKQIDEEGGTAGMFSNYVWSFVNKVAAELEKSHPGKLIGCCAYGAYLLPPDRLKKLNDNVVVMICKARFHYGRQEKKQRDRKLIEAWCSRVKPGNMYFWEYYNPIYSFPYLRNIPIVLPHLIADDLAKLRTVSNGEFIEAETYTRGVDKRNNKAAFLGLNHLNWYVTGRLMWDAGTDVDALLDEYYRGFYGPAAAEMKNFWEKAEELWCRNIPDRDTALYSSIYTPQAVESLMKYLQEARNKTGDGTPERKRIEMIISEISPLAQRVNTARLTEKPSYVCQFVSSPPVLDGEASTGECWTKLPGMNFVSPNGEKIPDAAEAAACFDDKYLYFFFRNNARNADTVAFKALSRQRDSMMKPYIWDDDSIEIFINPTPGVEKNYYQFIINAGGTIFDLHGHKGSPADWNSNIEAVEKHNIDSWTLEARLPLADIGLENKNLETVVITVNFIRNQADGNDIRRSCWSPTMNGKNNNPSAFGSFSFKKDVTASRVHSKQDFYKLDAAGFPEAFVSAYDEFLQARAGDNASYAKTGPAFQKAFESSGGNARIELSSLLLQACCEYLSLDIDKAFPTVQKALSMALKNNPDDRDLKILAALSVDPGAVGIDAFRKKLGAGDYANVFGLAETLMAIPEVELKAFELGDILKDKRNLQLTKIDPEKQWKFTALALLLLAEKSAPSFELVREKARQALCAANLRYLGVLLFLYAQQHDGHLPRPYSANPQAIWLTAILRQQNIAFKAKSYCPSVKKGIGCGMNNAYMLNTLMPRPDEKVILLADSVHYKPGNYPQMPDYSGAAYKIWGPFEHAGTGTVDRNRHLGGANVLFSDGSVDWLPANAFPTKTTDPLWARKK